MSLILLAAVLFLGSVCRQAYAQAQHAKQAKATAKTTQKDEYHRPQPKYPTTPQIPSANRYKPGMVFLEQADSLFRPEWTNEELQIVKGNVKFRQGGMWMYCDSAYYYPDANSLDAFGHVKMQRGDTLFVYADKLYYDGMARFARLRCGPSRPNVQMENRDVTLTTDSLDYDMSVELGWYADGGRLEDPRNVLTSIYGNYSPATKNAEFFHDVVLRSKDGRFEMLTDTLYYNTDTAIARIETDTEIRSENDTIYTRKGLYNTHTGLAELLSRSLILHRDSLNRVTTLEGDSIVYDRETRITRAYAYRDPMKKGTPMVINDTARKARLIGGYGIYNDSTREAMASDYPLMMEYSRKDTLFLRADTILTWIVKDTLQRETHRAKAWARARFFRSDLQGVADTITYSESDSIMRLLRLPIVWSDERQMNGDTIIVHFNDSTADWANLPHKGMMMEYVDEDFYDQLSADRMMLYLADGGLRRLEGEGSVMTIFLPQEKDSTYSRLVYAESSYLEIDMEKGALDRLKMWPEVTGNVTPIFLVKNSQKMLPKAVWREALRPRRQWYGDGEVRWDDDLGELPEELEKYFAQ